MKNAQPHSSFNIFYFSYYTVCTTKFDAKLKVPYKCLICTLHTLVGVCRGGNLALALLILNEKCTIYCSIASMGFILVVEMRNKF